MPGFVSNTELSTHLARGRTTSGKDWIRKGCLGLKRIAGIQGLRVSQDALAKLSGTHLCLAYAWANLALLWKPKSSYWRSGISLS